MDEREVEVGVGDGSLLASNIEKCLVSNSLWM